MIFQGVKIFHVIFAVILFFLMMEFVKNIFMIKNHDQKSLLALRYTIRISTLYVPVLLILQLILGLLMLGGNNYILPSGWIPSVLGTFGISAITWLGVIFLNIKWKDFLLSKMPQEGDDISNISSYPRKIFLLIMFSLVCWIGLIYLMSNLNLVKF